MSFALLALLLAAPPIAAGTGTALPAVRLLAQAFERVQPAFELTVARSIGSSGAPLAVRDGAVALGLMSRPFKAAEGLGLCAIPFARDILVVAAAPNVRDQGITSTQLVDLFAGRLKIWPATGIPLRVLQREATDSGSAVFEGLVPGLRETLARALTERRWRLLFHDGEMQEALLRTPGAVGLFDLGAIRAQGLPLQALAIDGVPPSPNAVASGRYPFAETLRFIERTDRAQATPLAAFLAFVRSPAGVAALAAAGYGPPPAGEEATCPPAPAH